MHLSCEPNDQLPFGRFRITESVLGVTIENHRLSRVSIESTIEIPERQISPSTTHLLTRRSVTGKFCPTIRTKPSRSPISDIGNQSSHKVDNYRLRICYYLLFLIVNVCYKIIRALFGYEEDECNKSQFATCRAIIMVPSKSQSSSFDLSVKR